MAPPIRSCEEVGEFFGEGWRSGPVRRAVSFLARWHGLRPEPAGYGLWLDRNSVHGLGMKVPLWVCGLDSDLLVILTKELAPRHVVRIRDAESILELPLTLTPPPIGVALSWISARDLDSLRDADRQPE
ncbi:MAG: hypothetical protein ACRDWA_07080 [Acidimicrobiia bacterium]